MPLLNNKLYLIKRTKRNGEKNDDEHLLIKNTNEVCENEEEFKRKQYLYNKKIWTCRFTNTPSLTFKEAEKSESLNLKYLKNFFKKCFEKATLQYVHNSKDSLETLVHKAWTFIHQEYCEYEPVKLKITNPKPMTVEATIVKVDPNKIENQENEDLSKKSADSTPEKKKTVPEKKRQFYVVKVPGVEKLVNNIPTDNIERILRPPSKENIKMCIRANASRFCGKANNSWIVHEDLVKKYKLADKNAPIDFKQHNEALKEASKNAEIFMFNKVTEESKNAPILKEDNSGKDISRKSSDSQGKTKSYKQTTLSLLKSASSSNVTSAKKLKSNASPKFSQYPPIAVKLIKMIRDPKQSETTTKNLIFTCANTMSYASIAKLPQDVINHVKERKDRLEEKKKLDNMNPEQRDAYYAEKRAEQRRKRMAENIKIEDDDLDHSCDIPVPFPLNDTYLSIDGGEQTLSQAQWSRILSVSEFVRCYRKLLDPNYSDNNTTTNEIPLQLTVDELCQSLSPINDSDKFVFASTVCMLLKPILQDEKIGESKQLGVTLSDIPATPCTTAELLRLALPISLSHNEDDKKSVNGTEVDDNNHDVEMDSNSTNNNNHNNNVTASKSLDLVCAKLKTQELWELSIEEKIETLEILKDRVMELDIMSNFLEEHQREVVEAYKRRINESREINDRIKELKQQKQEFLQKLENAANTINSTETPATTVTPEEGENVSFASKRKQSLELRMRESEEKEKRLDLERQLQQCEKQEVGLKRQLDAVNRVHSKAAHDTKLLMRVQPLGYDRHYSRYWIFPSAGEHVLFVETTSNNAGEDNEPSWGSYKTVEEVQALRDSLSDKGLREYALKQELELLLTKMREAAAAKSSHENSENGQQEVSYFLRERQRQQESGWIAVAENPFLWRGLKTDLRDLEAAIRLGSLGTLPSDIAEIWEVGLASSEDLESMRNAMLQLVEGVNERFLRLDKQELVQQVKEASSFSRLCFLACLLDAGIKWERAATGPESQKCRVCKRGHDESRMLLCDGCNRAFHTFCLRPPLKKIPTGEWLCQACNKGSQKKSRTKETQKDEQNNNNHNQEETSEVESAPTCCVCGDAAITPTDDEDINSISEKLAQCSTCHQHYHSACHEPPLRNARRQTNWKCSQCRHAELSDSPPDTPVAVANPPTRKRSRMAAAAGGVVVSKPAAIVSRKKSRNVTRRSTSKRSSAKRRYKEDEEEDEDEENRQSSNNGNESEEEGQESDQEPENITRTRSARKRTLHDDESVKTPARKMSRRVANGIATATTSRDSSVDGEFIENTIEKLLNKLYHHRHANHFIDPVDEEIVPDYYQIIRQPICISTMLQHQQDGHYRYRVGLKMFLEHVALLFSNAETYNQSTSPIAKRATLLETYFESIYSKSRLPLMYTREKAAESSSDQEMEH